MTSAEGGGGGHMDLTPLWLPLAVETRGVNKQLEQVGTQSGGRFSQAFSRATGKGMAQGVQQASRQVTTAVDGMAAHIKTYEQAQRKAADAAGKHRVAATALNAVKNNSKATATQVAAAEEREAKAKRDSAAASRALTSAEKELQSAHSQLGGTVTRNQGLFGSFFGGLKQGHREAMGDIDGMGRGLTGAAAKGAAAGAVIGTAISGGVRLASAGLTGMIRLAEDAFQKTYELGAQWDDVSDSIKIFTTTSGTAYEQLNRSAERVAQRLPGSLEGLGQNIGIVHSRLGLTGKQLEDFTRQAMLAGHMLGEQLDMRQLTGSMKAFGVPADQMVATLNQMWNVARNTGVPINDLIAATRRGAPFLKQFGLSFAGSAGLLAQFDQAGVDSTRLVRSLGKALGEFAKEGKDPQQALAGTIQTVQQLIDAGQNDKAIAGLGKLFGATAGTQIFSLIQQGTLSLDSLQQSFNQTGDSIDDMAEKTDDLPEKIGKMVNRAKVAARPLAEGLFGALGPQVDKAMSYLDQHTDTIVNVFVTGAKYALDFGKVVGQMGVGVMRVWALLAAAGSRTVGTMLKAVSSLAGYVGGFLDTIGMDEIGQGLKDLSQAGSAAMNAFDHLPDVLNDGADAIQHGFIDKVPGWQAGLDDFGKQVVDNAKMSRALGDSVLTDIPNTKEIKIEGDIPEVTKQFKDLGVQIETTPDGKIVKVTAPTEQAARNVKAFIKSETGQDLDVQVQPVTGDDKSLTNADAKDFLPKLFQNPPTLEIPVTGDDFSSFYLGDSGVNPQPGTAGNPPPGFLPPPPSSGGAPGGAPGSSGSSGGPPGSAGSRPTLSGPLAGFFPGGGRGGPGTGLVINRGGPAPTDKAGIARYIYSAAIDRGLSPQEAVAVVAYAIGESGLDPTISGGQQGADPTADTVIGLFQQKPGFARAGGVDPALRGTVEGNVTAYLNQLMRNRGSGDIYDQLLATSVGGPMHTGGRSYMDKLVAQARSILGFAGGGVPSGVVTWPPQPVGPKGNGPGGVPDVSPGRGPGIGLPDWSKPGTKFGPPPSDWWLKPVNPDDILFPDFLPPGSPWRKNHPLDPHRTRPLGFAGGGLPTRVLVDVGGDGGPNYRVKRDRYGNVVYDKYGNPLVDSYAVGGQLGDGLTPPSEQTKFSGQGRYWGQDARNVQTPYSSMPPVAIAQWLWRHLLNRDDGIPASRTTSWAKGGMPRMIRGPGTGTSDSIWGLVEGRQPIRVSNGESINTAASTARNLPWILAMNKGMQMPNFGAMRAKGAVRGYADGGVVPELQYIDQIAQSMGLTLGSGSRDEAGSYHNTGEARDYNGTEPQMTQFAQYLAQTFGTSLAELIHDAPGWSHNIKDGRDVGPFGQFYTEGQAGEHRSHVHVAVRSQAEPGGVGSQTIPGATALSYGDSTGGGGSPGSGPLSGSFANGFDPSRLSPQDQEAYAQEQEQRSRAITQAERANRDAGEAVGDAIKARDDALKALNDAKAGGEDEFGMPTAPDPEKVDQAQRAYEQAERQVRNATESAADSEQALADARKEGAKPSDVLTKQQDQQNGLVDSNAKTLGGGLVSGALEALGFDGSVFGDPTQWGIWKLFTGGLNWGSKLGQNYAQSRGLIPGDAGGASGGGGGGGLGNLLGGLLGAAGLPTPDNMLSPPTVTQGPGLSVPSAVSATAQPGSAVAPNVPGSPGYSGPTGAPPGPQGVIDQSVNFYGPVTNAPPAQVGAINSQHRQPDVGFPAGAPSP